MTALDWPAASDEAPGPGKVKRWAGCSGPVPAVPGVPGNATRGGPPLIFLFRATQIVSRPHLTCATDPALPPPVADAAVSHLFPWLFPRLPAPAPAPAQRTVARHSHHAEAMLHAELLTSYTHTASPAFHALPVLISGKAPAKGQGKWPSAALRGHAMFGQERQPPARSRPSSKTTPQVIPLLALPSLTGQRSAQAYRLSYGLPPLLNYSRLLQAGVCVFVSC